MLQPNMILIDGELFTVQRTFMRVDELLTLAGVDPATHRLAILKERRHAESLPADDLVLIQTGVEFVTLSDLPATNS